MTDELPPALLTGGYWHQQAELRRRYLERRSRPHWSLWWAPGCGKTWVAVRYAQALALDGNGKPAIYCCPSSLTAQVAAEAAKFWPGARIVRLRTGRDVLPPPDTFDIAVGGYELLVTSPALVRQCMALQWSLLVCDESHMLRSLGATRTGILLGPHGGPCLAHRADHVVFMTGTPLVNHAGDIYGAVRRMNVRELGVATPDGGKRVIRPAEFFGEFVRYENKYLGGRQVRMPVASKQLDKLRGILTPYCSTLTLADVAPHLPRQTVRHLMLPGTDVIEPLVKAGVIPADLVAELFALLADAEAGDDEAQREAWTLISELSGPLSSYRREIGSAKATAVGEVLVDRLEGGEPRGICFFHHRSVGEAVLAALHNAGLPAAIFYGGTNQGQRQRALEGFNTGRLRALVLQIDSAGQGLNLQACQYTLMAELPWTYAALTQAFQRTHRLGQELPTFVDIATVEGSLDAAVAAIAMRKAEEATALTGAPTHELENAQW